MTTTPIGGKIGPKAQALHPSILDGLRVISDKPGAVFELSVLRKFRGKDILDKGYFADVNLLACEAAKRTLLPDSKAVYVNLQEMNPDCLHRAYNKMLENVQAMTGKDIVRYRHFLVDGDRAGVKDISASDQEKQIINSTLQAIKEFLLDEGWPDPAFEADSGNGGHISWVIDLPATKETQDLLARCYVALNQKFGTDTLSIDKSLADPNQLVKLYGTWARKGDDTELRPHRIAKVLATYESECVAVELLQKLASTVAPPQSASGSTNVAQKQIDNQKDWWRAGTPEAVEEWAKGHELQLGERIKENTQDGEQFKWKVDCLTSDDHKDGACLILNKNGYLKYKCHHNSCEGKTISDVLAKYPPPVGSNGRKSKPTPQNASDTVMDLADVMVALETIGGDESLTPDKRKSRIIRELATAIGSLSRAERADVELTLIGVANAGFTKTDAKDFVRDCGMDAKQRTKEGQREAAKLAAQNRATDSPEPTHPFIVTNDRQLRDIVADAITVLHNWNEANASMPVVYVRSGELCRIVQDEGGIYTSQPLQKPACRFLLSELADWGEERFNKETGETTQIAQSPPSDVVESVISLGEWPKFPALEGIVNAPVFGKGGAIHTETGYNPQIRLYYTGGVTVGNTTPNPENVARSKSVILDDLLVDFPFRDDASKAHAVAYLILPFVRPLIDGPTPLHLVNSPTPGTGKGKLINACAYPALGYSVPTMTEGENDAEWRKRITAALMGGKTHLVIDNVRSGLDSSDLASALTQPTWCDRVLGGNREINIPVKTIWAATGNNIPVSEEISRRCVMIQLDANAEKPWERTGFKHENLMTWAKAHRNELVTAVLTLIQAWLDKGMPAFIGKAKGSYESWASVIGGILQTADIPGFLENENELFVGNVTTNQLLADFVKTWADEYKTESTSSFNLFKLASFSDSEGENQLGGWHNLLGDMLGAGNQRSRQTKLGGILAKHKDKVIAGWKILFDKASNGQKFYKLVEPLVERSKGSTTILPPVNDGFAKSIVEPIEPFCITPCAGNFFLTQQDILDDVSKKTAGDIERSMEGSTGSTDNFAYTNGSGVNSNGYAKNGVEPSVERSTENGEHPTNGASIPFMMTRAMERDLLSMGFTQAQIDRMTPSEAWEAIQREITAGEVVEWTL